MDNQLLVVFAQFPGQRGQLDELGPGPDDGGYFNHCGLPFSLTNTLILPASSSMTILFKVPDGILEQMKMSRMAQVDEIAHRSNLAFVL